MRILWTSFIPERKLLKTVVFNCYKGFSGNFDGYQLLKTRLRWRSRNSTFVISVKVRKSVKALDPTRTWTWDFAISILAFIVLSLSYFYSLFMVWWYLLRGLRLWLDFLLWKRYPPIHRVIAILLCKNSYFLYWIPLLSSQHMMWYTSEWEWKVSTFVVWMKSIISFISRREKKLP